MKRRVGKPIANGSLFEQVGCGQLMKEKRDLVGEDCSREAGPDPLGGGNVDPLKVEMQLHGLTDVVLESAGTKGRGASL